MRYSKADIGRVVGFMPQSPINYEITAPSGDYTKCPTCNGSGIVKIQYINRTAKTVNGHTFQPGVNVEYRDCGRCEGESQVWVEDKG